MGKKRKLGQLEAAAPPKPAEPKPEAVAISADDAGEAKPAELPVAKGEEAKTEEVVHKRKKQKKRKEVMEMQSTVIEQCADDVEKIEPLKKKEKEKPSEMQGAVANGSSSVDGKPREVARQKKKKKLSAWKKQVLAKWKERVQVCSKEKVEEKPKPINCSDVCVICRQKGHIISTCPLLSQTEDSNNKSGNKLPDCPQPLQDVDLKHCKAEKLLGCPPVETL